MKFPTAYTILFGLIILVAALTWIIPAGSYDRENNEALGKDVPVPGTYKVVESNPQGFEDVILAPIAGFYDPDSYEARAIDVALFVLIIGGFLGVVASTGAIDSGIAHAMHGMKGHEKWMIPIMMALFAAGGTIYGMAEETLAFYALIIPVMIAAGYDALTGVAIIMLGAGIGTLGSTINPFATVIASDAAGIPFTQGMMSRFVILGLCWLASVAFVMRYAEKVRRDPSVSLIADRAETNRNHFLGDNYDPENLPDFTGTHKLILMVFGLSFAVMIWGVSIGGWWMARMSALFIVAALIVALIARMGEESFTSKFVDGARDLLGVALIIGIARGIVVVMDAGNMTDTVLYWAENMVEGMGEVPFVLSILGIEGVLSALVPSSSGLAVLTMPIMAPLADFAGVSRDLVITAYQSASGWVNLFIPTSAVVMGGLALGRVPYNRWVRFIFPLLVVLSIIICLVLAIFTVM